MKTSSTLAGLLIGAITLALAACGGGDQASEQAGGDPPAANEPAKVEHVAVGEYVNPEDSLPRIRYFDGGVVSINNLCPVRKVKLGRKMSPAYVNRHPVGFC